MFNLPPEIKLIKKQLPYGFVYEFHHNSMGQLGRLVLEDDAIGQCRITSEVSGDPDDPMTAKRLKILEPLTKKISDIMSHQCGDGLKGVPMFSRSPDQKETLPIKIDQCEKCDKPIALIIFAEKDDLAELENCARKMYHKYSKDNLPTYIIGPMIDDGGPEENMPAKIMRVWCALISYPD
ncbi:MAG: hypothetical protein ISR65_18945 [Bacteriovoracaceae bacterium]|nr:hypothetical protein [Bacteriovoracaceae bacterium]